MPRLNAIDPGRATGRAKDLLDAVKAKLGLVPNMMRTMAASPAVLEGYLVLTNYFNKVAETAIDFPKVEAARRGA